MLYELKQGWQILQDVHDAGEKLGMYREEFAGNMGNQVSEWEPLPELKQLQLIYAEKPYFGRELRYFNDAPWWYKNEFELPEDAGAFVRLTFTNVDYYCKVWLNGCFVGEHEGYSIPFSFDVSNTVRRGTKNTLTVKVWSPWDNVVDGGREDKRTSLISRNMVKGTYEHSDTFVQRDANPVGIYGSVTVETCGHACFEAEPDITYTLSQDLSSAELHVKAGIVNVDGGTYTLRFTCRDVQTGLTVCSAQAPAAQSSMLNVTSDGIRLWNTWDKGGAWLYEGTVTLLSGNEVLCSYSNKFGFRKIELVRDAEKTRFYLNGRAFYVRGTAYFPDLYVSNMCRERYRRDLMNVRAAGFNMIRVHVHVDLPDMYELCTELGIGIMQDSEYNWMHPATDGFADRFINVYLATVQMLKKHTSMLCWICMNEPGLEDPMGTETGRAMTVNPGPRLYKAVTEMDPSRPAIKGSYCTNDLTSGDSHNYTGSLYGEAGHYSDIYGYTEKLNTEYGFDAPPCVHSLAKCPQAFKRLSGIADQIGEIQDYQYKLLKYYTEHYRMQKYSPNSGYVQFLFSDMCPQSFYGLYDWWGLPKEGLKAMLESNMPTGIFLKYSRERVDGVYAVNDTFETLGNVTASCAFTDADGNCVCRAERAFDIEADGSVKLWDFDMDRSRYPVLNCCLTLMQGGKVLAVNHYEDLFSMPAHIKGHPSRISHEIGMRLYFA